MKIDVAIADDQLDRVIEAITKAANTGKIGDGKIFVVNPNRPSASVPAKPIPTRSKPNRTPKSPRRIPT